MSEVENLTSQHVFYTLMLCGKFIVLTVHGVRIAYCTITTVCEPFIQTSYDVSNLGLEEQ